LDGRLESVDSLLPIERLWTFLAAHTAIGNLAGLERDWSYLPQDGHLGGLEAILQTHLFAGYPRTLNALAVVDRLGCSIDRTAPEPQGDWRALGEQLCQQIYGSAYSKLRTRVGSLHSCVDTWMLETGYGRVLSRPGLTPRQRELCVVAVLSGQNVAPQLHSHLRGAMHVGATPRECAAVIEQTHLTWGVDAHRVAHGVWMKISPDSASQ